MTRARGAAADPLMEEMSRLAKEYGDPELLRVCQVVIGKYATLGASRALMQRKGDKSIDCEACREREAQARQIEETLKRSRTGRPIGGAAPSQIEEE